MISQILLKLKQYLAVLEDSVTERRKQISVSIPHLLHKFIYIRCTIHDSFFYTTYHSDLRNDQDINKKTENCINA